MVSVLILAKNESKDIGECLDSVSWSDDVHVYDSMSTDDTVRIAMEHGATVTSKAYPPGLLAFGGNEAAHRNWALSNISFKYPWVFTLDADERANSDLAEAIRLAVESDTAVAYRVARHDYLMSTWLHHVQATSSYIRLFRPMNVRYERLINPVTVVNGSIGELDAHIDHYPFSKGYAHWIDKHNSYSTLEARQFIKNMSDVTRFSIWKALSARDSGIRRYHQKGLFSQLPFRPLLKFLGLYFGKAGFLDGRAGFTYATLQSVYEYFIVLKTREIIQQERLSK